MVVPAVTRCKRTGHGWRCDCALLANKVDGIRGFQGIGRLTGQSRVLQQVRLVACRKPDISHPVMKSKCMPHKSVLGVTSIFSQFNHYLQPPECFS